MPSKRANEFVGSFISKEEREKSRIAKKIREGKSITSAERRKFTRSDKQVIAIAFSKAAERFPSVKRRS